MRSRGALLAVGCALLTLTPASAQETKDAAEEQPAQPMALIGAQVAGHEGPVTVLIARGKIRAVDSRARPMPGMLRVDVRGARVAPGRIDAFASLGSPDSLGNCLDAFDTYDVHSIERALAGGVTTVVLTPLRSSSISGLAAVIKLKPGVSLEERTLIKEAALCTSLGLGSSTPPTRATQAEGLRKTFEAARAYQEAWLDYEEALEKYAEELKKTKAGGGAKTPPPPKPGAKPAPKKPSGPTKPKQPRRDRGKELVVRVLKGELPLRVEAHRVADMVCCLELQEEFGIKLILEGATEGHLLADVLAAREIPVVLGPVLRSSFSASAYPLRSTAANAALLHAAGVQLVFGTDWWASTPHLQLNAQLAVGAGLDPAAAEEAVTHGVARLLGLGDRLGRVAVGYDADLVVYRTGPCGEEQVRAVLIDGELVYQRKQ